MNDPSDRYVKAQSEGKWVVVDTVPNDSGKLSVYSPNLDPEMAAEYLANVMNLADRDDNDKENLQGLLSEALSILCNHSDGNTRKAEFRGQVDAILDKCELYVSVTKTYKQAIGDKING